MTDTATAQAEVSFARVDARPEPPDASLVRERSCPWCGAQSDRPVVELGDFQFFTDEPGRSKRASIRQALCGGCGGLYMNPCYSERGFERLFREAGPSHAASDAAIRERASWVASALRPAAGECVVDLGCHDGRLLSLLPSGPRRVGLERDAAVLAGARARRAELEFVQGDLAHAERDLAGVQADVVLLFHVLEHLPDPCGALQALRRWMGERGRLVVEVPVLELARGEDLVGFFTIQHLSHFTRASLAAMLAAGGFEPECALAVGSAWRVVARPRETARPASARGRAAGAAPGRTAGSNTAGELERYLGEHAASVLRVRAALDRIAPDAQVAVWGAGNHTEYVFQLTDLFRAPGRRFALFDGDPEKQGGRWRGVPIHATDALRGVDWSATELVLSSYGSRHEMAAAALRFGVPDARIVDPYADRPGSNPRGARA